MTVAMTAAPAPGSDEWARVVTASKVAAILGLSPWESPRTMWLKMRGDLPSDNGKNADDKARGHYLEPAILAWWLDRHPNLPVVEAKSDATADDWGTPGTDEAPAYYVAQAMWQLWVTGAQVCYVPVLFGRPQLGFAEYVIARDDALIADIVATCRAFYESLTDDDAAPALSDHVAEYDAIRTVHADIDRDLEAVIPDDIADRYLLDLAHADRASASKARVLELMGSARVAKTTAGMHLARRQPKGDAVVLVRTAALPQITTSTPEPERTPSWATN